jgi:hypothetical protein
MTTSPLCLLITAVSVSCALYARSAEPTPREHLLEIITVLQKHWLHRETMNWQTFEQRVLDEAATASSLSATVRALVLLRV